MSNSNPHQVSSRDFIKGTTDVIGGRIGALIGIPSIASLFSRAVKSQGESDAVIGILGDVISGPPSRPLDEFVTKIEDGELFVQVPPIKRES